MFRPRQFGKTSFIVYIAVLIAWLAAGLIVIALLNVAKFLVRSSPRVAQHAAIPVPITMASGDSTGAQQVGRPAGFGPPGQSAAAGFPPPIARRSA